MKENLYLNINLISCFQIDYIPMSRCRCKVRGCSNQLGLLQPKTDAQFQSWKNAIGSASKAARRNFLICCKHFSTQHFERDFQFELTGKKTPNYVLLKKDAMPDTDLGGRYLCIIMSR